MFLIFMCILILTQICKCEYTNLKHIYIYKCIYIYICVVFFYVCNYMHVYVYLTRRNMLQLCRTAYVGAHHAHALGLHTQDIEWREGKSC